MFQSKKLAKMNMELAEKNQRMNVEIQEKRKLNFMPSESRKKITGEHHRLCQWYYFWNQYRRQNSFLEWNLAKITRFTIDRWKLDAISLTCSTHKIRQNKRTTWLFWWGENSPTEPLQFRGLDGTFRSVELAVSMLRQDEKRELRVVGAIMDVGERRRAERALSEAERNIALLLKTRRAESIRSRPMGNI